MGMKLKSGADLCGFQLTNFCVQGEASAPSDAALGRKYFHTNATDDVATGVSLLNRERIYLGEGAWRATAYLDDIAAINEKLNLITGDTDTDTLINNLKDLEEFLKDFSETDKLKSLLDGKLNTSGGTIDGTLSVSYRLKLTNGAALSFVDTSNVERLLSPMSWKNNALGWNDGSGVWEELLHSGNYATQIGDYYLKSSGGTVDGPFGSLIIHRTDAVDGFSGICFTNEFGTLGYLGIGGGKSDFGKQPSFFDGSNTYALIHSGNIGSYKAGGLAHSNGTIGAVVNSSGNVTIGAEDKAGTSAKLYVDGVAATSLLRFVNNDGTTGSYIGRPSSGHDNIILYIPTANDFYIATNGTERMRITSGGDVRITGNLIVDKEISAGGAGAEEGTSGSGSAEGVAYPFTPTSTSMAFDHNLGEDVIVQVYEKSGNVWNMVMVDTEITSATKVTLRFGKTETTQHKVVIMGV